MCSSEQEYDQFANCFDAVNCAMHAEMKVEYTGNCQELFINQMIPHHQNAVNMAKTTLLYVGSSLAIPCEDNPSALCPDTEATDLLREIIQNQNAQIQYMREYLGTISGALAEPVMCSPRCTGFPINVENGDISKSDGDMHGSVATFSCDDGFALTGTASVTCSAENAHTPWPTPEQKPECTGMSISVDVELVIYRTFVGVTATCSPKSDCTVAFDRQVDPGSACCR